MNNSNDTVKVSYIIRRTLVFSLETSLCCMLALVLKNAYLASSGIEPHIKYSFFYLFSSWLGYQCLALINLLPAIIIRFLVLRQPPEGQNLLYASLINYSTVIIIVMVPYDILITLTSGNVALNGIMYFLLSCAARVISSCLLIAAGYMVLKIPQRREELPVIFDDSTLCLSELGIFIDRVKKNLGTTQTVEKLWQPIYTYLGNKELIKKLVHTQRIPHDEITLNAIGYISSRMLASGELHTSSGALDPQGEYVYGVWQLAAQELVRRSYNTENDVSRGLEQLKAIIMSPPAQEVKS